MCLDCEPPISGGREIWASKKLADVSPRSIATPGRPPEYAGRAGGLASMAYKHENPVCGNGGHDPAAPPATPSLAKLSKTQVNLKLIPDVDGSTRPTGGLQPRRHPHQGWWHSPARLHLIPTVNQRPWPICRCGG